MPLLDHFRPPLSEQRPWGSFHATFASALADYLNEFVLPAGFLALEQVQAGAAIEIDVGTFAATPGGASTGGPITATRTVWLPAAAPAVLPADFPPSCTVEILMQEGGRTLVAAIELVSPGNKDRAVKRRQFAAKCATYLSRGVGLIVLDLVTSRHANLHNELIDLLSFDAALRMPDANPLYCAAYRPLTEGGIGRVDAWPMPLQVGQPLPTVPLSLEAEHCLPVDLEAAYAVACQRRRLDEALP